MKELLKEVGRGKRGARDLTYEEAVRAAEMIVGGEATPAQAGAFLVAERIKMESTDEIMAFVDVLRPFSRRHPLPGSLDCAGPYDGRTKSFMAALPVAFVLASCGVPVSLHASRSLPPKWGVTLTDVLFEMGIHADIDTFHKAAAETGVLFTPAEEACPPLAAMRQLREELGLRTVFNTAEKLLRYSDAPYLAFGVFHGTVFEKMTELVTRLGVKRALITQGMEGSEDLPVNKRTRAYLVDDGVPELLVIDPELYNLYEEVPDMEWTASAQAQTAVAVLRGECEPAFRQITVLNAAVRLWLANAAGSIEAGLDAARTALDSGEAHRTFEKWAALVR
ncbi:anthranilate phosphoribosyltransferase [Paenibacillus alkalitolerans]|uniref:anthranilate phosphoribosyltransferase n=1 Tax=Paenibacillus alkalitolerans TaxID=2799335 RepID=UPI0018F5D191|nr:anthranilate phosphoribosyltransferase [Paenibacillus alkalitolerans]